ncbi:SEC-C metal-binding domain-containing protein [Enterobacter kobei]|nr:SEC-C metal-binding domain-containing protein [Enterobacter kobei]MDY3581942.1 SEC-C metal-binding domain-containing protein [Enterobacter kobei]
MMSLWDALRMNMMISYQELVRTFPCPCGSGVKFKKCHGANN